MGQAESVAAGPAIQHLATLASVTATPLTGATLADMVKAYTDGGWKADAAVLDALAAVTKPADQEAVNTAVAHVYKPWLRDAAELFQKRVKRNPAPRPGEAAARSPCRLALASCSPTGCGTTWARSSWRCSPGGSARSNRAISSWRCRP